MARRILRLSTVKIFPRVAVQAKYDTSEGNIGSPKALPRVRGALMRFKDVIEISNIKQPSLERDPT
jgi:hypothetical protein